MPQATVPVILEDEIPTDCEVDFTVSKSGTIFVTNVARPVKGEPRTYVDVEVPEKTLDWIECWLYDNWSEY